MGQFQIDTDGVITFVVSAGETSEKRYETAAWYKTVALDPGVYPVRYTDSSYRPAADLESAYYVGVEVPGTVTDSNFVSLFGGVPFGSYDRNSLNGERETIHFNFYNYDVRAIVHPVECEHCGGPCVTNNGRANHMCLHCQRKYRVEFCLKCGRRLDADTPEAKTLPECNCCRAEAGKPEV